ncbi:hypothetical protein HPP92_020488 [Vanilla planifolia]|uniref:Alpha-glucosidase n=1 Tax=Vanilla planifolia TaxID=51239 RepID=A0A835Q624_VANPL|nr:hypothetical protein HPP92_020488 [Vanilla planifolia]
MIPRVRPLSFECVHGQQKVKVQELFLCLQNGHLVIINAAGAMRLMQEFVRLTWNIVERFPDPKALVNDLHAMGIKAIWMLDPGIKYEEGYFVYESGSKHNLWILKEDENLFVGDVWPGPCVFPDFTKKEARLWWANLVKDFVSNGVDGIWNDMNEPAIFKLVNEINHKLADGYKTMPESNIHREMLNLVVDNHTPHYHNVYGMLMARSTYEGMKMANEGKRPFVLTRAGFIGSQRYAATWTGDNLSNWEHLHMSVPMIIQLGLSGQPLSGPDIGGFAGNATPRLFGRWMGVGAMFPFCRGHSEAGTIDQEPWSFGKECEEICRLAILRRYRLIPHIYTLFYKAHANGTPIISPTFFADPKDQKLRKVENSFLLGSLFGLCKSTIPERGSHELSFTLPAGTWMRFDFDDSHPDLPILFLQGGSILPVGPTLQHLGQATRTDELSLFIALDKMHIARGLDYYFGFHLLQPGKAEGVLFEDDGDGYGYTQGAYLLTYYAAALSSSIVTVSISRTEGLWKRANRSLHVHVLLGGGAMVEAWGIDGEEVKITMPTESEVFNMASASEAQHRERMGKAKLLPDAAAISGIKGFELSKTPVEIKGRDWLLKVVPCIGGRMISMIHLPSATQWLHSRVEADGYEEYSSIEYRSAGCSEEYQVVGRNLEHSGEEEALTLEGDIGGGLVLQRSIFIPKDAPQILAICSRIIARNVGAGSGGFSRMVCLRVHPTFYPVASCRGARCVRLH